MIKHIVVLTEYPSLARPIFYLHSESSIDIAKFVPFLKTVTNDYQVKILDQMDKETLEASELRRYPWIDKDNRNVMQTWLEIAKSLQPINSKAAYEALSLLMKEDKELTESMHLAIKGQEKIVNDGTFYVSSMKCAFDDPDSIKKFKEFLDLAAQMKFQAQFEALKLILDIKKHGVDYTLHTVLNISNLITSEWALQTLKFLLKKNIINVRILISVLENVKSKQAFKAIRILFEKNITDTDKLIAASKINPEKSQAFLKQFISDKEALEAFAKRPAYSLGNEQIQINYLSLEALPESTLRSFYEVLATEAVKSVFLRYELVKAALITPSWITRVFSSKKALVSERAGEVLKMIYLSPDSALLQKALSEQGLEMLSSERMFSKSSYRDEPVLYPHEEHPQILELIKEKALKEKNALASDILKLQYDLTGCETALLGEGKKE